MTDTILPDHDDDGMGGGSGGDRVVLGSSTLARGKGEDTDGRVQGRPGRDSIRAPRLRLVAGWLRGRLDSQLGFRTSRSYKSEFMRSLK